VIKPSVLVVDDEPNIRDLVQEILEDEGYKVDTAENAATARKYAQECNPDLILLDIWMPDTDGITLLKEWQGNSQTMCPVIMMSGHGTVETAVEATRLGAYDFLEKPLSLAKLLLIVQRALEKDRLERENKGLRNRTPVVFEPIGKSAAIAQLKDQVNRLAQHDTRVLLVGEPGCGKETLARYLHAHSARHDRLFIDVGVGTIAPEYSAVEFFGKEQGDKIYRGLLEQAHGGTLFLDEIADMDPETQRRLLSALESGSFLRVGGNEQVLVDVRVISSTRRELDEELSAGRFRQDLYYLLNEVSLKIPPLREHNEDVPELLNYYLDYFVAKEKLPFRKFSVAVQNLLRNYFWRGNIRELKNLVQRLLILGSGHEIEIEEVKSALGSNIEQANIEHPDIYNLPLKDAREHFEKSYLQYHLEESGGSVTKLSAAIGMERTHLYRKLHSLGIKFKEKK